MTAFRHANAFRRHHVHVETTDDFSWLALRVTGRVPSRNSGNATKQSIGISLVIAFLYGSLLFGIIPNKEGISWEGHLAGLITGFLFALIYKTPEYKKLIKYDWQQPDYNPSEDKFMQRFDENGIFVNPPVIEEEPECESYYNSSNSVNYEFKEKKLD